MSSKWNEEKEEAHLEVCSISGPQEPQPNSQAVNMEVEITCVMTLIVAT